MATFEYNELYLACQNTGIYHIFVFDIVNSKEMSYDYRKEAQNKMIKLMLSIYKTIQEIEITYNRKILVFEQDFVSFESHENYKGFGFKQEPFLFGDTFGFTIYRDSLDTDTIYYIYEYSKKELGIDFDFHIADGYYETNEYCEGNTKYFRGYCMDLLSVFHKTNTKKELENLNKKRVVK